MFTIVFSVCLMSDPETCQAHVPPLPPQESFSTCLDEANNAAALFARQYRDRQVRQIYCQPSRPGQGR